MRKSVVILGIIIIAIAFFVASFGVSSLQGVALVLILLLFIGFPITIIGFFMTPKRREY